MSKKLNQYLVLGFFLSLILIAPSSVYAGQEPPPDPGRIEPPPIIGLNSGGTLSEGDTGEVTPSGTLSNVDLAIPDFPGSPSYVKPAPGSLDQPAVKYSLSVPLRSQNPSDVTCGAAALGMAMDFATLNGNPAAPSTDQLAADLQKAGLLYEDIGTGVEELAYLARNHGYRGSYAFHNWTLEQLAGQLEAGNPPVVALGANGANQPGHFVTVTGISEDGSWVRFNDPILGEKTLSAADFLRLWSSQGFSGLMARAQPLSTAQDPMLPWMGLFGTLSVLAMLAKAHPAGNIFNKVITSIQASLADPRRQGLGGKLEPVYQWKKVQDGTTIIEDTTRKVYEYGTRWVQKGWKWVKDTTKKVYEYGTRMVQKGWKWVKDTSKKIYEYGTRWVRRGWKTVKDYSRKIYEYGTRWVRRGWKTVKDYSRKIYKYGTRWVRKGWKKVTTWVKGVWGWFKKVKWKPRYVKQRFVKSWRYATKRVPRMVKETFVKGWHYATKKVPNMVKETFVKGWHYATKRVPNMVKETFVKGWHYATKRVPNTVKETFVKGWHYATKEVPRYIYKKVQVGWREVNENLDTAVMNPDWWRQKLAQAVSYVAEFFNRATQRAQAITGLVNALFDRYHNAPWYAQAGISLVPGADLIDIGTEVKKWITGEDVDKWVLGLAAAGLILDVGWADGPVPDPADGGNVFVGAVKALLKQMPDGASRELLEKMLKDPDQYRHLYKTLVALQKNGDELAALLKNDEALAVVLRRGPEAVDFILEHGDEAIEILAKHGDEGLEIVLRRGPEAVGLILEHGDEAVEIIANHGDEGLAAIKMFGDDAIELISSSDHAGDVVNYLLRHADEGANVAAEASRAISAAERLREVGLHADEAEELIETIAKGSTHGNGSRVVLGPFGVDGTYIKEAVKNGGVFYETPPGTWEALGKSRELAWAANERFLLKQLEDGIPRIDFVGEGVKWVEEFAKGSFRWREIKFLKDYAHEFGYKLIGNSWVKVGK